MATGESSKLNFLKIERSVLSGNKVQSGISTIPP
jgi:hypothetical protein